MGKRVRSSVVLAAVLACVACAGSWPTGVRLYGQGRYPEALEELESVERDALGWRGPPRARYCLYRGLTHLALGHREATARWLGEAQRAHDADPLVLDDADAGRLASAWAHLEAR